MEQVADIRIDKQFPETKPHFLKGKFKYIYATKSVG